MPSFTPFEGVLARVTKLFQNKGKQSERGATLITFTFVSFFLVIPVIGLAIDGAIVMWEKARLSASVDAAALAAGRGLSVGSDIPTAQAAASKTATAYFNANFQPGTMGTTATFTPQVPLPVAGLWTINADATINVPLYFTRLLGVNKTTISAHGQITRRNVNVMVVLDRSASLVIYSNSCPALVSSAQNFTNMFVGGQDVLGLITFQTVANVDFTPGLDFKSRTPSNMSQVIGQLNCSGYTNTVSALKLAYDQITSVINQPGALNVIVFFSDGKPDAITADFIPKKEDFRDAVPYPFADNTDTLPITCSTNNKMTGVLVAMDENADPNGPTLGVIPAPSCPTCGPNISSLGNGLWGLLPFPIGRSAAPGCTFSDPNASPTMQYDHWPPQLYCTGASCEVRKDIESIPPTDSFGNKTNTGYRPLTAPYGLFPSSSGYTAGLIRPDTPAGVVNASLNAAFGQIQTIRSDKKFNITIYSIGLGSYVDENFMKDVANDANAPNHDPSSPTGQYIYAPSASQLSSAFQQIASQVLRISQ